MRWLSSLTLALLATQARLCSALHPYTLSTNLTCSTDTDAVHFTYTLNNLDTPPAYGSDVYEAAYRLTYKSNNKIVSVPVQGVAAQDGTGYTSFQSGAEVAGFNKDNVGATTAGDVRFNGTILHHQQLNGVSRVAGVFDVDMVSAATAGIVCVGGVPNVQLIPLKYSINGINQLVLNAYTYPQQLPTAVYAFDVQPALNIDSCYIDPTTGNIRVPWRVSGLATTNTTERAIVSLLVTNHLGDLVSSWTFGDRAMQIGTAQRDPAEPSIIQASQPSGPTQVFGRIDFAPTDTNVTCTASGKTNIRFEVIDYSTINPRTNIQTFHYIPGAADNGLNPDAQLPVSSLTIAAAAAPPPPSAAKCAARKAAAQKAAAAAKAKADAAAAAAVAKAAAAAVPGVDTPCTLRVPANPLTSAGLATPYILGGGCNMADTAGFVQAVWISKGTGQVQMYNPLVVQQGKQAAVAPGSVTLPADAVVGLWFGSNADMQQLVGAQANTLAQANCVTGVNVGGQLSIFGQVAACNAPAFFQAAAVAVFQGLLTVPALGTASDGKPCPTVRDFVHVDQDPADNLNTQYLLDFNGNTAVNNAANLASLTAAAKAAGKTPPVVLKNPGDNPLLDNFVNPTFKCNSWKVPNLSNPGVMNANQALNEVHAAYKQAAPVARQPAGNPMCTADGTPNLNKLNACRSLIGEAPVSNLNQASTATFCRNMVGPNGAQRLLANQKIFQAAAGPNAGQSLFQFLQDRFAGAVGPDNLACGKAVPGLTNPLAGGAVIAAAAAFSVSDALLVGSQSPDNQPMDPTAELSGQPIGGTTTTDNTPAPIALVAGVVGGLVVLVVGSMILFNIVKKRRNAHSNVVATTARESKV